MCDDEDDGVTQSSMLGSLQTNNYPDRYVWGCRGKSVLPPKEPASAMSFTSVPIRYNSAKYLHLNHKYKSSGNTLD